MQLQTKRVAGSAPSLPTLTFRPVRYADHWGLRWRPSIAQPSRCLPRTKKEAGQHRRGHRHPAVSPVRPRSSPNPSPILSSRLHARGPPGVVDQTCAAPRSVCRRLRHQASFGRATDLPTPVLFASPGASSRFSKPPRRPGDGCGHLHIGFAVTSDPSLTACLCTHAWAFHCTIHAVGDYAALLEMRAWSTPYALLFIATWLHV